MKHMDSERILSIPVYYFFVKRTGTVRNYEINGSLTFPGAHHLLSILSPKNIHLSQDIYYHVFKP